MSRLRSTLVTAVLAVGLVLRAGVPVVAQDSPTPATSPTPAATTGSTGGAGGDTAAIAINTKDGTDIFRIAFAIKRAMGDVVDNGNAAVAFASCTDCETVAVSIQVVLLMNDPSVVTPTNLAIAINEGCTLCETLASAYQVILTTDGPVRFTAAGYREICGDPSRVACDAGRRLDDRGDPPPPGCAHGQVPPRAHRGDGRRGHAS